MNVTGFDPNSKLFVDNCKFLNNTALVVIPGNDGADNVLDSVFVQTQLSIRIAQQNSIWAVKMDAISS